MTFSPAYVGTRPAQMITAPFVTSVLGYRTRYKCNSITFNSSTVPKQNNIYQVVAQFVGDNIYAPVIAPGGTYRL